MTVFNQHTVHELDDLLKALSYQVAQITQANLQCASWKERDPKGQAAWSSELSTATAHWARASHSAMRVVEFTPHAAWDFTPVERDYQAIAKAFQPFEDLARTFAREAQCPMPMPNTPQPTAPDLDLKAFQATDAATKWIDQKAADLGKRTRSIAPLVLGGLGLAVAAVLLARRVVGRAIQTADAKF
jgi:hypothetical protein